MPNNNNIPFNPLHHPNIKEGYLISPYGDIKFKDIDESHKPSYHSSNGYDYAIFITNEDKTQLFPIDEIIGMVYIPIPNELFGKKITIKHIDGDTRNISLDNMEWIEDIEIWKVVTYPGVKPNTYEVSNHGRIRNIKTGHILTTRIYLNYAYHNLMNSYTHGSHSSNFRTHRIVAYSFVPNPNILLEVNHIDMIKTNNHYRNLEWIDRQSNELHYYLSKPKKFKDKKIHERLVDATVQDSIRDELLSPDNMGSILTVYHKLKETYPFITPNIITGVKSNLKSYRLTNKYDVNMIKYPKSKHITFNRLSDENIDIIIEELLKPENHGSPKKVFEKLRDSVDRISYDIVKDIKRKRSTYVKYSKKYNLNEIVFPEYKKKK